MGWEFLCGIIEVFQAPNEPTIKRKLSTYTNGSIDVNTGNEQPPTGKTETKSNDTTDGSSPKNKTVPQDFVNTVASASELDKNACFEILNQTHREYAEHVIKQVFNGNPSRTQEFFKYARDQVNLELLYYAMVTGIIHRNDSHDVNVEKFSSHVDIYPQKYFDMTKIETDVKNRNGKILKNDTGEMIFVHINDDGASTNQDPNVYFAKDIGLNWHYRHWYEVNPFLEKQLFPVNRSRGESFYYEHQQLLARYNFEMLCNGLPAVQPSQFNITDVKLEQGSNETAFEDLISKSYEKSFISNLDNTDQKSKGLLDNILQAETALRDPMFYRRCKHMDDSFYQKKKNLNQYTDDIRFEGINISKVEILPQILETFWEKDAINITQKMAPSVFEKIYAVHTHLQHEEFEYKIEVENNFTDNENVSGTVRIFLAPHSEEKIPYEEKRRTFVEMDKFVFNFTGSQTTVITRKSGESTVINGTCGWPRHLLVGKGTEQGFPCDLFVIITKNEKDETDNDRRPLGFPFDRDILKEDGATKNDILDTRLPNMSLTQIKIKHLAQTKCSESLKGLGYPCQQ